MAGASHCDIDRLVFGDATTRDLDTFEHDLELLDEERLQGHDGARRPSAYVDVFESTLTIAIVCINRCNFGSTSAMVKTVLELEHSLLSDQEIDALDCFRKFCCKYWHAPLYCSLVEFL